MVQRIRLHLWLTLLLSATTTRTAHAQGVIGGDPANVPPGRIVGIVEDSLGSPMVDALVTIFELRRTARTRADGSFRFDSIKPGAYRIGARALGYIGAGADVRVGARGAYTKLTLISIATTLAPMVTQAEEGGLSGVIGDTAWNALADVEVRVLATQHHAKTDSLGRFSLPLAPGRYMVRLERPGYQGQHMGVTIAADHGRKIAAWMAPMEKRDARETMRQANLFELERRMIVASTVRYKTFTREDLMGTGGIDVAVAAARASVQAYNPSACAYLDGGPAWAPLWSIGVDEIEFMEVNVPMPPRATNPVTSLMGNKSMNNSSGSIRDAPKLSLGNSSMSCTYGVWLRK